MSITCFNLNNNIEIETNEEMLELEIAKKRYKISLLKEPLHDPQNLFTKT